MTTSYSHRPWTTLAVGDGAAIKDALGNQIAVFSAAHEEIANLKELNEELKRQLAEATKA